MTILNDPQTWNTPRWPTQQPLPLPKSKGEQATSDNDTCTSAIKSSPKRLKRAFFRTWRNKNAMLQRNQRLNSIVGSSQSMQRLFISWKHKQLVTPKIEGHVPLKMERNPPMRGIASSQQGVQIRFNSQHNSTQRGFVPPFFSIKHIQSN